MAQTLLIGLGGTGSRVVNNVVKELHRNGKTIDNGELCCAVLDTNVNDNEMIINSNTGVPVFGTSKPQKIRDYLDDYHYMHMETWCPQSPAFLEQSMIDGASEMRIKSRVAFMDAVETGITEDLEKMINEVLKNGTNSKIRVMIVTSLSGGTGSGMFIQVALWLRKFLSESEVTIRGIFLLPDVFIQTIKDIRNNKATSTRHYCNAYAAIRELNAITKIMKNNDVELSEEISLDKVFDSLVDKDSGKHVFDFAFFVDDRDENGIRLNSIGDYERMVAQLVYMQLFAPMKDDMYSEEDNAFLSFSQSDEPLYGSCGTAKAEYPTRSVKMYCALRAAQDSITGGWHRIDSEIDELEEERKQAEREGVFSSEIIDRREMFIKLFDEKTAVTAEEAGSDRFFLSLSKETKNAKRKKSSDGKVTVSYSDKITDFIKLIKSAKIDVAVTSYGGTDDFSINAEDFIKEKHTTKELIQRLNSDELGLAEALVNFKKNADKYTEAIINGIFPFSMGDVRADNRCTIYGLLTNANAEGHWEFVHPVAAKYLLYKLVAAMKKELGSIDLAASEDLANVGGDDVAKLFDNEATSAKETTPLAFLESKPWYIPTDSHLDEYEKRYAQFIEGKIALCATYQKELLQTKVYQKLIERIELLIAQLDAFFGRLGEVQKKLSGELATNIGETQGIVGKTIYVFGSKDAKEELYSELNLGIDRSNSQINKAVIDAIYGSVCAKKRPSNPENAPYAKVGVVSSFTAALVKAFRDRIDTDENNRGVVNMDIYTALCRESDATYSLAQKAQQKKDLEDGFEARGDEQLESLDVETGDIGALNAETQRHQRAFMKCKDQLFKMAAPFLIHSKEITEHELGIKTIRPKTFWGFHPAVTGAYSDIGRVLGVNADLQADPAYSRSELYCYRAVYGMEARYIPKFNEMEGGAYYTCYKSIVDEMIEDSAGKLGARAFVRTPHLDMRWHKLLPYITQQMEGNDTGNFYHGFWLAIAYGLLRTDKDGYVFIRRAVDHGYGAFVNKDIPVMYKDKHLTKTDVVKLVEVLMSDKVFTDSELPKLEERLAAELEDMTTYVDTDVLKGLTTSNEDMNPINVISRYFESPKNDIEVAGALLGALTKIASELAGAYQVARTAKQQEKATYTICKKIYDSSTRKKGKSEIFSSWEEKFAEHKIG